VFRPETRNRLGHLAPRPRSSLASMTAADGLAGLGLPLGARMSETRQIIFKQQVEVDSLFLAGDFNEDGALVAGAGPFLQG